ncbi:MAG TPA: VOC family protein [Solirubrobacteraceae bacterium]|nr:VOC family protein [Solirubrobacteraceae bacterium]
MIGRVRLRVADLERARSYYERVVGLQAVDGGLGADRGLVELIADPDAPPAPPGTTGLFHLAILVPDRPSLARAVQRVLAAGERFTGASDHFVSEALYLRDPEGNGIEIYRDRPRSEWEYEPSGEVRMGTVPLDVDAVMAELPDGADSGMPDGTVVGHVHLHVADLAASEAFYAGELGLAVTTRGYPGALFLSHEGYHHHVGVNTWQGEGAPPPPPGSRGLEDFEIVLPGVAEGRLADPSGNRVVVRTASRRAGGA